MTPEQTAMRAKAEQTLAEKFERLGDDNARETAERCVAWLLREGWRPWPNLADRPAVAGRRARGEVKDRAVAHAKRVLRTPHSDACTPEMRAEGQYAGDCRRCELIAAGIRGERA